MTPASVDPAQSITLSWLVRLRWGAVVAQAITVAITMLVFGIDLPLVPLGVVIGVTAATNLSLRTLESSGRVGGALIGTVLVLDTILLSVLLGLTGGPSNPFSTLYLLHVTLAVVVLGGRWGAGIVALAAACSAAIVRWHVPLGGLEPTPGPAWTLHLRGTWFALIIAGVVIAYFVARISAELRARERELARVQAQISTAEKLSSLTTLAAGAAHELGTPLATIAVVSKELARSAEKAGAGAFAADAQLIREQVERCRGILVQMSAKAGEHSGELPGPIPTASLVDEVRHVLAPEQSARLDLEGVEATPEVVAPRQALVQVLSSLVRNAFDASPADARVTLGFAREDDECRFFVRDTGSGMPPEVLARAGDPFFSTKPPGRGMGLGLFLARAFAEGLGGRFALDSRPGAGTMATLALPRPVLRDPTGSAPVPHARGNA